MDQGDIKFFLDIIEGIKKELKTDITTFKNDAHGLLKESMHRIEKIADKLTIVCNDHDDRINSIELELEHIKLEKMNNQNTKKAVMSAFILKYILPVLSGITIVLLTLWLKG